MNPHPPLLFQDQTDEFYDSLAALAVKALKVPVAFVSFVESHRQVFRGRCTINTPLEGATETPLSHSICQFVAANSEALIIDDTREHTGVSDNLAVTELNVIAYAGVPIFGENDVALGAFCAIDHQPRKWSSADVETLISLASQVSSDIRHRLVAERLQSDLAALKEAEANRARSNRYDRHDLRTPLNALLLNVQAMRDFGELNEDQNDCYEMALRNGESLLSMIDKMLDVAIIEDRGQNALRLTSCHLRKLIHDAMAQVSAIGREKGLIVAAACEFDFLVTVDRDKFVRVLVNLLSNAVKFTSPGGEVKILVEEGANNCPSTLKISVQDSGMGIKPDDLPHIFKEGYMADPNARTRHSTGLGLAFCKRVIEAHESELMVTSTVGKGTTFSFFMPQGKFIALDGAES